LEENRTDQQASETSLDDPECIQNTAAVCKSTVDSVDCDSGRSKVDKAAQHSFPMPYSIIQPNDDEINRDLIEICTSGDSVLGQITRHSKGCRVTRITQEIDFLSTAGLELSCKFITGPRCVVWFSLPCVGGCPWQFVNIQKGPNAERRIRGYWALFTRMWRNAICVIATAHAVGATIAIEWPRACRYWYQGKVLRILEKYGLEFYDFDGCMYDIRSQQPKSLGEPIRKPWRIATNSRDIGDAFSRKCSGHTSHAPCEGRDTRHTESYSPLFASIFHQAFRKLCSNLSSTPGNNVDPVAILDQARALAPQQ
jgi:hypothetical protein